MRVPEKTVESILQDRANGESVAACAVKYGVTPCQVYYYTNRRRAKSKLFDFGVKDARRVQYCLNELGRDDDVWEWVPVDEDVPITRQKDGFVGSDIVEVLTVTGVFPAFYGHRLGTRKDSNHWYLPDGKGCTRCVVAWRSV